jgi:hypothetical protein
MELYTLFFKILFMLGFMVMAKEKLSVNLKMVFWLSG